MISFLAFSVNCSQVGIFQIMPALCPHGQGKGGSGQPNVDRPGQGEGESPKFPNLCGNPLWMTPINIAGLYPANLLKKDFLIEFFKGFLINKNLFS